MTGDNQGPRPEPERVSPTAETVPNIPMPSWPPAQPQYVRREVRPTGILLLLGGIALIVIVASLSFFIFATTSSFQGSLHTNATSVARSTAHAQHTAQAFAQATANGYATANANIYASATATNGVSVTQTAGSNDVAATATANTNTFTQDTSSTASLTDQLDGSDTTNNWDRSIGTIGSGCSFHNGTYHVIERQKGSFQPCLAQATSFSDFVYEVQMTVDTGTQGGIVFRADGSQNNYYFFRISTDGYYFLDLYDNNTQPITLTSGYSAAITTGLSQQNTIAVMAVNDSLQLFINQQYVATVTNNSLSSGSIGVAAYYASAPTEIEFSSAQVWDLTGTTTTTPTTTPTSTFTPAPTATFPNVP